MALRRKRCIDCDELFLPAKSFHRQCWSCWREDHAPAPEPARVPFLPLDSSTLRSAVSLTHPDRHPAERQEQATDITAKLIAALAAVRAREAA